MIVRVLRKLVDIGRQDGLRGVLRASADPILSTAARALLRPMSRPEDHDEFHSLFQSFVGMVNELEAPRILEIGSRARSGNLNTSGFRTDTSYCGMDILEGPNVHIVGDAHRLSESLSPESFDAAFSISVFEHLAMPWKVAVELNRVLKPGGLVYTATHPTWPAHDRPWDFFRFSSDAFRAIFHPLSGFEILEVREGLPCRIVPLGKEPSMHKLERCVSHLAVGVIARKIAPPDPRLRWDIDLKEFLTTHYPE